MRCPVCEGKKVVVSEKNHPQNTKKERPCYFCGATGEVDEIETKKSILKVYKYHGCYSENTIQ